jgi:hypothetical protein
MVCLGPKQAARVVGAARKRGHTDVGTVLAQQIPTVSPRARELVNVGCARKSHDTSDTVLDLFPRPVACAGSCQRQVEMFGENIVHDHIIVFTQFSFHAICGWSRTR